MNTALTLQIGGDISKLRAEMAKANGLMNGFSSQLKTIGAGLGIAFGVSELIGVGKEIVNVTAKYQKFGAVLQNNLGSRSGANEALNDLKEFATKTPFQVDELTASFIKLNGQGFKPTMEQMTSLGDLAASQGKSFNQLSEAILDAMTGENERLKEFGIKAKKSGDQVTYTFKGVSTTIKNTSSAVKDYILSLGNAQGVSGSMAAVSTTLGGKLSNIGDNIDQILGGLGNKSSGVIGGFLDFSNNVLGSVNEALNDQISALQTEQAELNVLVGAITDVNVPTEVRKTLITELNQKYPDFLKNLDAEKVTNEQLTGRLKDVNDQFLRKIALQTAQERFTDVQEDILDLIDEEVEARKMLERLRGGDESLIFHDDPGEGLTAQQKRLEATDRWEQILFKTQAERTKIQADLNAKLTEYNSALGFFNTTANDYFATTTNSADATDKFAASLVNLKSKIKFLQQEKDRFLDDKGNDWYKSDLGTDNKDIARGLISNPDDPIPGLIEQAEYNDEIAVSLANLAETRKKDAEAMKHQMQIAQELGSAVGDSFSEAASGQKTWAQALQSLIPRILKLLLAEATASIITAGAKDGAKSGNVIVGLAAASIGAAAIGSMFSNIGAGGGGSGSSSPGRLPSESSSINVNVTGQIKGSNLEIIANKNDYRRSQLG